MPNIFKKYLNFQKDATFSLFQQVEKRIISHFKENITSYRAKHIQSSNQDIIKALAMTLFFCGIAQCWSMIDHGETAFLMTFIFYFASLQSGVFTICDIVDKYQRLSLLKKSLTQMNQYNDLCYKTFIEKSHTVLTSEEIQELFKLPLRPIQREFLEQRILNTQQIFLSDLAELPLLLSEEEEKQLKLEEKQESLKKEKQCLADFFEEHQVSLTIPTQLQTNNQSRNEKEINLSSLL